MERIIREVNHDGVLEDGFRLLAEKREYVTYPEDSTFRVWFSDIPWKYENHFHSAVEIIVPLRGTVSYLVEGTQYDVEKGEILIVPPGMEHSLWMEAGSSRQLFLYEPEPILAMRDAQRMSKALNRVFYLKKDSPGCEEIRNILLDIVNIYQENDTLWNTACYSGILKMYSLIGKYYLTAAVPKKQSNPRATETEVITGVMTYINNHYQEEVTLDQVASFAGFSRYYFSRYFRQQTGSSFKDFLCQKRLQVAIDLLTNTRKSIQEIARESGFGSVATFNRIFREYRNCTPTQFRAIYAGRE